MVELETMYRAQKWWDKKYPDRLWKDMRIGDRQRAILVYIKDDNGFAKDLAHEAGLD